MAGYVTQRAPEYNKTRFFSANTSHYLQVPVEQKNIFLITINHDQRKQASTTPPAPLSLMDVWRNVVASNSSDDGRPEDAGNSTHTAIVCLVTCH